MALTKNRLILAKAESTYGTSSVPAGTDAVKVSALEVEPLKLELKDRELIRPYLGSSQQLVSQKSVGVKFAVELAGSGTAGTAPRWGVLMKSCGFAETIVATTSVAYSPVSTGFSSCTLDFRADGVKHLITGVRGTWKLDMKAGDIPKIAFEFIGIYNTPTDTALPTTTFTSQADPVTINSDNTPSVSVFGYSACMESFSLDLGADTPYRQLAGCSKQIAFTGRAMKGDLSIEAPTIAAKDYFTAAGNQTLGAISFTHGTTAGNICAISVPNAQLDSPAYEDSDGVQMLKLPFMAIPSSSGNDEFLLTLT